MGQTFSLGRISGIQIGVNWSVLVIAALLAYGLAVGQFPAAVPGRPAAEYVAAVVVTAVAYLGSLLAHELAHSLVARRNGLKVEGITLWLLGGVSQFQGEVAEPGAEVRVAGVGPLVSLVLGGAFLLVAWLVHVSGVRGLVVAALAWLGGINIVLAVFNVIPAAPLDGGRLLQAVPVAHRRGPAQGGRLVRPVRAGIRVGPGRGGSVPRPGPARIQLVVVRPSRLVPDQRGHHGKPAGHASVRLRTVAVRQIMTPNPVTLPASATAAQFLGDYLPRYRHSAFPVVADGQTVGLVTGSTRCPPASAAGPRCGTPPARCLRSPATPLTSRSPTCCPALMRARRAGHWRSPTATWRGSYRRQI